ncbi:MAG: hypothetical protein J3K34DRAFT_526357 [Monoraphidium minutum]|nr:MAG: hypothetical protein J3K34DRAFT_526357 [Monoraphidium minutum]
MQAKAAALRAELRLAREQMPRPQLDASRGADPDRPATAAAPPPPQLALPGAGERAAHDRRDSQAGSELHPATLAAEAPPRRRQSHGSLGVTGRPASAATTDTHRGGGGGSGGGAKHAAALSELERRQESYMRREERLQAQLAAARAAAERHGRWGAAAPAAPDSSDAGGGGGGGAPPGWEQGAAGSPDGRTAPGAEAGLGPAQGAAAASGGGGGGCLDGMQLEVICGVEGLLERQRLALRAEEAAALRQARAWLAKLEARLAAEREEREQERVEGGDSLAAMRQELGRTQAIAEKLDAMCQLAGAEAARLRVQFGAQEDDRQHLIRRAGGAGQMLLLKRDNYQLRRELGGLRGEMDALVDLAAAADRGGGGGEGDGGGEGVVPLSCANSAAPAAAGGGAAGAPGADAAALPRLQRLLASGQRQLRALRAAHVAECGRRARLHRFLVDTLEQLRRQGAAQAGRRRQPKPQQPQQQQQSPPLWGAGGPQQGALALLSGAPHPSSARCAGGGRRAPAPQQQQRPSTAAPGARRPAPAAPQADGGLGRGKWSAAEHEAGLAAQEQLLRVILAQCFADLPGHEQEQQQGQEQEQGEDEGGWEGAASGQAGRAAACGGGAAKGGAPAAAAAGGGAARPKASVLDVNASFQMAGFLAGR